MEHAGFNPKVRWDRHPQEKTASDDTLLNERIHVLAWFKEAKILPRAFIWKDKIFSIKKVNYFWQERCGQETINYFSVTTDVDLYQLSFSNLTYGWKIDKILS